MPVVNINILAGKTREQKEKMISGITDVIHQATDVPKEKIWIIINDIEPGNWASDGKLKG